MFYKTSNCRRTSLEDTMACSPNVAFFNPSIHNESSLDLWQLQCIIDLSQTEDWVDWDLSYCDFWDSTNYDTTYVFWGWINSKSMNLSNFFSGNSNPYDRLSKKCLRNWYVWEKLQKKRGNINMNWVCFLKRNEEVFLTYNLIP